MGSVSRSLVWGVSRAIIGIMFIQMMLIVAATSISRDGTNPLPQASNDWIVFDQVEAETANWDIFLLDRQYMANSQVDRSRSQRPLSSLVA